MSVCCIGGVCIPYSAILPLLLIVLQYIAKPLHNAGLLPDIIASRLGLTTKSVSGEDKKGSDESKNCANSACCAGSEKDDENDNDDGAADEDDGKVLTIESMEEFQNILSKYNTVIVKMTAEWCKPCKVIHPFYEKQLATRYKNTSRGKSVKYLIVDVDELDDVAAKYDVSILPCFVALKNKRMIGKYTGSDEDKLEAFVKDSCSSL